MPTIPNLPWSCGTTGKEPDSDQESLISKLDALPPSTTDRPSTDSIVPAKSEGLYYTKGYVLQTIRTVLREFSGILRDTETKGPAITTAQKEFEGKVDDWDSKCDPAQKDAKFNQLVTDIREANKQFTYVESESGRMIKWAAAKGGDVRVELDECYFKAKDKTELCLPTGLKEMEKQCTCMIEKEMGLWARLKGNL